MLIQRGHHVGNHTFNHVQGLFLGTNDFVENTQKASSLIQSPLFRPPHGHMRIPQTWALRKYYKRVNANEVFDNVKKFTRNGSIIVFHDSLKARKNMMEALPRSIEWLISEGYKFKLIDYNVEKENERFSLPEYAETVIPEYAVNRNNRKF
jgi:peptidoglycan/xylan/chitin deacetylase (PgdA/CDA1 family)